MTFCVNKMNINSLLNTVDYLGPYGIVLSLEESIILHNSLLILQNENHFRNVYYWGKIYSINTDYYIAYGYIKDALLGHVYYYSQNMTDWMLLPPPSEHAKILSKVVTTNFLGDPTMVIDVLCEKDDMTLDKKYLSNTTRPLKEEDRLAAVIFLINEDARVVPRGGLFKRPDAVVVENLSFEGLCELDAQEQASYLHYRAAKNKWNTNLLTRKDYNYAIDFLDTVDMDVPKCSWTVQICEGRVAIVRSLYWPGLVFYQVIDRPYFGCLYVGNAKKNLDIPFALPSMHA